MRRLTRSEKRLAAICLAVLVLVLLLFIGQVARGFSEREAGQEIDYRRIVSGDAGRLGS